MSLPGCGYAPSIGAGKKRFYLVRTHQRSYLIFWYALSKSHAFDGASPSKQLDVRTLPAKYTEGLRVDTISDDIRQRHREALKRAAADGFDFKEHCFAEVARMIDELAAQRARMESQGEFQDDDVPF